MKSGFLIILGETEVNIRQLFATMRNLQGYITHKMRHGTQEIEQENYNYNIEHLTYSIKQCFNSGLISTPPYTVLQSAVTQSYV